MSTGRLTLDLSELNDDRFSTALTDERVVREAIIEVVQNLTGGWAMSLAELMPLVESLSQADRQQLMSFLSIQQPDIVVGRSLAQPPGMGIADCYGICSDDPIILDNLGVSEARSVPMIYRLQRSL